MRDDLAGGGRRTSGFRFTPRTALAALLAFFALYLLAGWTYNRFFKSDETKIRETIAEAAQAARERHPARVTNTLAEDFRGPGGLDRETAYRVFSMGLMNLYRVVAVEITPATVPVEVSAVDPTKATARFRMVLRGRATDDSPWEDLNPRAGGTEFRCTFRKIDGEWKFSTVEVGSGER
ncbi:MAG: hypothetical protein HS116_15400 [Planctomycetes bacterium]|nr:hypothetical protein [Planctomycetota bacterium]